MKRLPLLLVLGFVIIFISGCQKNSSINISNNGDGMDYIKCTDEQKNAVACADEYNPVCGDDGENYGNPCYACVSKNVNKYSMGECIKNNWDEDDCDNDEGICSVDLSEPEISTSNTQEVGIELEVIPAE